MRNYIIGAAVVVVLAVAAVLVLVPGLLMYDNFLKVLYYDVHGNPLQSPYSIVGGSEGVSQIAIMATVQNTGQIPIDVTIVSASPGVLQTAFSGKSAHVEPGAIQTITSSMFPTAQFEGQTVDFSVTVMGSYTYAGQAKTISKSGSISVRVDADRVAAFTLSVDDGLGTQYTCVTSGTTCSGSSTASCCSPSTCSVPATRTCLPNNCSGTVIAWVDNNPAGCQIYQAGNPAGPFLCHVNVCYDGTSPTKIRNYLEACGSGNARTQPTPGAANYCSDGKIFYANGNWIEGSLCHSSSVPAATGVCDWIYEGVGSTCGGSTPSGDTQCS
jgi:hypothetical protein